MSEYNIKAARDSFIKTGAYLARDLGYLDEITDARVYRWRTGAMSLVRIGKQMFSECENRDTRISKLEGLAQRQDKKLRQCATIIYKHHPELYDEIRGELKIYEALKEADDG